MRNTTKLKAVLTLYSVRLDCDDEFFVLTVTKKQGGTGKEFQGKSYSDVISKAYSYLLSELRKEEKGSGNMPPAR